jgi:Haemolysin-III related
MAKLPKTDCEKGLPDSEESSPGPTTMDSTIGQRKQPLATTEHEEPNGFANGFANGFPNGSGHLGKTLHKASRPKPRLVSYEQLPAWYQDNEHILGGYRPESFSASTCFRSWAYIHNETFNIYSHLIPAVFFLFAQSFILRLLNQRYPKAKSLDYIVFSFFLLSACVTLTISFTYHTLMNHSMKISHLWLRLDYLGILALTLGDFVSGIRLTFYCEPTLQKVYWAMVRLFLA